MRKSRKTSPKNIGPVIYVGPGFRDSRLNTYMIFADGIPAEYREDPVYRHLFVTPGKVNEARELVKKKGSLLNTMFQKAISEHENKKGGK